MYMKLAQDPKFVNQGAILDQSSENERILNHGTPIDEDTENERAKKVPKRGSSNPPTNPTEKPYVINNDGTATLSTAMYKDNGDGTATLLSNYKDNGDGTATLV